MASAQSVQKVCACRWALLAVLFLSVPVPGLAQGDWRYGRATFYGDEPWYWDIHYGSCAHDYIWPDQSTGWDVAALADTHPDYSGSCGSCYEIQCSNGNFRDGYGADLDRSGMCHSGSVIVKVTDTCPCNYPNNYYSNKRWCCGDMPHFDLSVWAFEKIADKKWGVISIKYRKVDCSYTPEQRAWADSTTMPVFPTSWQAMPRKDNFDWYKYFPNGGWTNHRDGQCYQISTSDYLKKIGKY